jgi:hypothetical protein
VGAVQDVPAAIVRNHSSKPPVLAHHSGQLDGGQLEPLPFH